MDPSLYLRSELLSSAGFVHAFFTRAGGASSGPFGSLNLSLDVGDRPEDVAENRFRVARALGFDAERLYVPRQVHERGVLVVDGREAQAEVAATEADAIVSDGPGLACAVRTADCVPILLADRETRRVAAVHAGWRGVVKGVASATLATFRARGSRPEHLVAAIGPHISAAAFEVGQDVALQLSAASLATHVVSSLSAPKAHVDLARILVAQLTEQGLSLANIDVLEGCTLREPERFISYRRDGKRSGRQLSAIVSEPIRSGSAAP